MPITVTLDYDPDAESPFDCETEWRFVSFHPHYDKFEDPRQYLCSEYDGRRNDKFLAVRRKLECDTAWLVSLYDHSGMSYTLKDEGYFCPWDTTPVAALLLWEGKPDEIGDTPEKRRNVARCMLEAYTRWVNGQYLCYSVETDDGEVFDSCCGFDNADYMFDVIRETLADYRKEHPNEEVEFRGYARDLGDGVTL